MTEQPYTLNLFDYSNSTAPESSVECFGIKFDNEEARRSYFLELLRKKLQEPEFRNVEGFPIGEDEDILAISDPPYYTACPNPWLTNFIEQFGKQYDTETDNYQREPFTADVSEGKTDGIFTAHSYHTKVPHKAIVRYILHYTEPDDIILDAFGGSGMTGVAAQVCAKPDPDFRYKIETERKAADLPPPKWGSRRVVLNDLGVAATFIEANYNLPFNVEAFEREARRILNELKQEIGWMYETLHTDGKTKGQINYTIWSEVFACPECGEEIIFLKEALEQETKRVKEKFPCPHCSAELTKDNLQRLMTTLLDPSNNQLYQRIRFIPVFINYSIGKSKYEKELNEEDIKILNKIEQLSLPVRVPTDSFPIKKMYHGSRLEPKGFTKVHHLFLPRADQALGILWSKAIEIKNKRIRNMMLFFVEQIIWTASLLNRYRPTGYSQVNQYMTGVYYVASQHSECSPWYILDGKLQRLTKAFSAFPTTPGQAIVATGTAAKLGLPDNSIDYIFTDPPFGENIYYSDLNFLVESWHRVHTDAKPEAIVDKAKGKELLNYQKLMQSCFEEYNRVLKPGRWMTVVFHNSRNTVWNAIQEGMLSAGFVVADVRTLDKQQGSYRQVTSTAVKQDLVISAYKPTTQLEKNFELEAGTEEGAWEFVQNHLKQLPVFISENNQSEIIVERLNYLLFDRMVAFHIQRDKTVPLSASEFYLGLEQRFSKRDDMYFLPEQLAEYEKKRMTVKEVLQLELFITDESSAILWLKQQLTKKPYKSQDLNPIFMKEKAGWSRYEKSLELNDLLRENFICYEGEGVIPTQIVSWLKQSSIYRERIQKLEPNSLTEAGLETTDTILINEAKKRWYIPDPNKTVDIEKLRERSLLKEFEEYKHSKEKKFKIVRLEAVRAGFKKAWQERNYQTIIDIASRIHDNILQEDSKLLMWYDQALNRVGDDNV
ncbi:site-specific DNA-methyltransferase [Anabaena sp. UHCC 0253]|uniref:DNA methyltransferase n=1 Tax=Anabaena sp. UHCC 0253 TaxID=2590019 RepID=UPI001446E3B3|nr:DNA methyltransferase [Anabaena sp. UHCC 0253]MTJ55915.1 site-specific DNA-methyltransferase [Anabaena sp. UHCC 0253]